MDLSPQDRDLMIRTVIGEAADQPDEGKAAVAHVILNRLANGNHGSTPGQVVLERGAFEPWSTIPKKLLSYSPDSKIYQKVGDIVDGVASGDTPDPTNGATNFLNEDVVRSRRGGSLPSWANGDSTKIGQHTFYGGHASGSAGGGDDDLLGSWSAAPTSGPQQDQHDDLLSAWPTTSGVGASKGPTADDVWKMSLPEYTNYLVSQIPQNDSTLGKIGTGTLVGLRDIANTAAQGITWAGEKGANALQSAGAISPESAQAVSDWRSRVNSGIGNENDAWNAAAAGSGAAEGGRILGNVVGTGPMVGAASARLASMVPSAVRAAVAARPILDTAVRGVTTGALTSGLTSSSSDAPLWQQMTVGGTIGGVLGPLFAGAGRGLTALGRLSGVDTATAQLADMARNRFGIPIGAGQMSSNAGVRFMDSVLQRLPLSGHAADVAARQSAFNRAVIDTMQGPTADNAGPAAMAAVRSHLSNEIETTLPNLEAHLNPNVRQRFQDITDATDYLPAEDARIINKLKDDAIRQFTGVSPVPGVAVTPQSPQGLGRMSGRQIQNFIAKGSPLDRAISGSNSNVSHFAGEIKETLLDAVGETPTGQAKRSIPYLQDLARYERARFGWKNMKTIEPLAEKSTTGDISPGALLNKVSNSYGNIAYGGGGNLADLGRIGTRFLKEPNSSGTAERAASLIALAKVGGAAAGLGGAYYVDPADVQKYLPYGLGLLAAARGGSALLRNQHLAQFLIDTAPGMAGSRLPQTLANWPSRWPNARAPLTALLPTYYRNERPKTPFAQRFSGAPIDELRRYGSAGVH